MLNGGALNGMQQALAQTNGMLLAGTGRSMEAGLLMQQALAQTNGMLLALVLAARWGVLSFMCSVPYSALKVCVPYSADACQAVAPQREIAAKAKNRAHMALSKTGPK